MAASDTILLAVDFSPASEHAVAFTTAMAKALDARVVALYVDVLHAPEGVPQIDDDLDLEAGELSREKIHAHLDDLEARLKGDGVQAEGKCCNSLAIAPAILEVADEIGARFIIAGTHGLRGMRRFMLGSVTDELLRTAHRPLILVPQYEDYQPGPIRRLLVPLDFSSSTPQQLEEACDLASSLYAAVNLLHVKEPLPLPFMLPGVGTLSDLVPSLERQIDAEIEKRARFLREHGIETHTIVVEGHAAREIVRVAKEHQSDLILIARHGLSRVERFLLGSITERVARTSRTPVLVYPDVRTN